VKLTKTTVDLAAVPAVLHGFLVNADCFDSSCSPNARVIFIDKDGGYFLKTAPKGTLKTEADMTGYFHAKGFAARVIAHVSEEKDYLLTEKLPGEDCITEKYLAQPERLCDILAERLALLHSANHAGCPVTNHTETYIARAKPRYAAGCFNAEHVYDDWGLSSAEDAIAVMNKKGHLLQTDTLIHGDYCLPNIILEDWRFSGFVDVGGGGVGDRHMDIYWGMWSLAYNLKTKKYRDRFIDAYGRSKVDEERLRIIAACEILRD
jgi:kanamycin kinase